MNAVTHAARDYARAAAPRRPAAEERVAAIAKMPGTSTEEHRHLPTFGRVARRWCNGCASAHCRRDHLDLPATLVVGTEKLSTVSRARVEKKIGRSTAAGPAFGGRGPRARGHNQS